MLLDDMLLTERYPSHLKYSSLDEHISKQDVNEVSKMSTAKAVIISSPNKHIAPRNMKYLKEHIKFRNTAEFYVNNMKGDFDLCSNSIERLSDLESRQSIKKSKSKRILKKLNRKAVKIAANRLKVESLIADKPHYTIARFKNTHNPFNVCFRSQKLHISK